jgi:dTDP-4-amino-4,6-dideoxygalactose transaminase
MKVKLTKPYFSKPMQTNILKSIEDIFKSNNLMLGKYCNKLEKDFSRFIGCKYAVSVNSATTALQIALRYSNAKNNEIIVPAASFITNINSVLFEGGIPILVDCNKETLSFDIKDLLKKITKNTKAIIWVHLTGYIANNYKEILKIAKERNILVIEDASHAHGSSIDGRLAGNIGDIGVFSFYPTKVITAGTGGIITTNNNRVSKLAKSLRLFGKNPTNGNVDKIGNDWFLDEFRCAVVGEQVNKIKTIVKKRETAATFYYKNLPSSHLYSLLNYPKNITSCWYNFPIFFKNKKITNFVMKELLKNKIECKKIYKPINEEIVFKRLGLGKDCKNSIETLNSSLCLPLHSNISRKEQITVINNLKKILYKLT